MKIALASDEPYPVHKFVLSYLKELGHDVVLCGSFQSGTTEDSWVQAIHQGATLVNQQDCEEGIFFCWTGTGASIVSNKLPELRAALCTDAETARGARLWNHANVLVLSNRLLSEPLAKEIIDAWFEPYDVNKGLAGAVELKAL